MRDDFLEFVAVQPGADPKAVQVTDRHACWKQRFPIAEAQSRKEFQDSITGKIDQFLFLIYALLSLSVIVSLFGIVNTLVLSIHERTREIGMMRAIGTPQEPGAADRALRVGDHGADRRGARPRGRLHPGRRHHGRARGRGIHPVDPVS